MTWDILTTESLGKALTFRDKKTLPGACESLIFDVIANPIIVEIRLRLKSLD